ncbi:hypothetical protein KBT16_22370 [Nostoc sp. CCCryo 231-06]|nr:hypothetical protein [Nostoc sp. CCCryo 231-06]
MDAVVNPFRVECDRSSQVKRCLRRAASQVVAANCDNSAIALLFSTKTSVQ